MFDLGEPGGLFSECGCLLVGQQSGSVSAHQRESVGGAEMTGGRVESQPDRSTGMLKRLGMCVEPARLAGGQPVPRRGFVVASSSGEVAGYGAGRRAGVARCMPALQHVGGSAVEQACTCQPGALSGNVADKLVRDVVATAVAAFHEQAARHGILKGVDGLAIGASTGVAQKLGVRDAAQDHGGTDQLLGCSGCGVEAGGHNVSDGARRRARVG